MAIEPIPTPSAPPAAGPYSAAVRAGDWIVLAGQVGIDPASGRIADGVEALAFLRRQGNYAHARRPDLILLDLNLPRKDGREVLAEIKADDRLKRIPVVILTTSQAEEDILRAYNLNANCYVSKPVDLDQFIKVVGTIKDFWLTIVKLPAE